MNPLRIVTRMLALVSLLFLAACASGPVTELPPAEEPEIAALTQEIRSLAPDVDPDEAARAARISLQYPRQLALQYGVTDPPLRHNMLVNMGLRDRGLCWHWADDLQARLEEENFRTLTLHRAIANADSRWRIDHSTVIVSARGEGLFDGIVLDPWRNGGLLHWSPVTEDPEYVWVPRQEVFAERIRQLEAEGRPVPQG
ncbi:hypothetical protein [Pontivivens ytuae]|uniref:Lipoprotein n=1 Tax=Pontivivens ytuae TaxID=2789856 RepID=A0A7S9LTF3_9RHOB|nr:hypothetical protein [Pontivivens ytuae]QPH54405.1 hypothetical protein I0K15_01075 [Pontivivens ytuae]